MRSESDGHCLPTTFPGLAVREAAPAPARCGRSSTASATATTRPSASSSTTSRRCAPRSGWSERVVPTRVERIVAVAGGFELDGSGPFSHVLVATGHPGLARPEELRDDPRVVHSYEPHDYGESVCVVGAGLAAATEWLNALAAGATVISVRRREPVRRPLNVPRQYLSKRGLRSFWRLEPAARVRLLQELLGPSYPSGAVWDEPIERARAEGRFRIEASVNGADQVIAATGFLRGYRHDPLLARLAEELRARDGRPLARPRPRLHRPCPHRPHAHPRRQRRRRPVRLPGRRHARGSALRRPRLPAQMSYTLRGRLESRLAALLVPLLAATLLASALQAWWPLELAGAMIAALLALDVAYPRRCATSRVGRRCRSGLLELGVVMATVLALGLQAPVDDRARALRRRLAGRAGARPRPAAALAAVVRRGRRRARPRGRRPRRRRRRPVRRRRRALVVEPSARRSPGRRRHPRPARRRHAASTSSAARARWSSAASSSATRT